MNKDKNNLLTSNQITLTLIGYTMGIGILGLPDSLVKNAHQDAWISAALGALYPLYLSFLAIYISNKHSKENILVLSQKYCGNFIGGLLNFGFLIFFTYYLVVTTAGAANIFRVYVIEFLSPVKIMSAILIIAGYAAHKGIKVLGRVNELIFYIFLALILTSLAALRKGSIQNLLPVFQSGILNILKSTKESMFSYSGIESIFLIYPFINDSKKIKYSVFKFVLIIFIVYTYVTFITLFYLGPDTIPKSIWSFTIVIESFILPVINNFRFIFTFIWTGIALRLSANYYYATVFILKDLLKRGSKKRLIILIYPLLLMLASRLSNETIRRDFMDLFVPKLTIFSVLYISLIALLIFLKGMRKIEKK